MHNVCGIYGFGRVIEKGMMVGANAKVGMDNTEFAKYLSSAILPLYPDAADSKGKRVAIIVDSDIG